MRRHSSSSVRIRIDRDFSDTQRVAIHSWLTRGYSQSVEDVIGMPCSREAHESNGEVRDIELYSMCEHHMLPFFGRAHIAYIPKGRSLALEASTHRRGFCAPASGPERLTEQVARPLRTCCIPRGVGVVIRGCPPLHDDARSREAELADDYRALRRVSRVPMTRDEFLRLAYQPVTVREDGRPRSSMRHLPRRTSTFCPPEGRISCSFLRSR